MNFCNWIQVKWKYNLLRLDTLFKKDKYIDLKIIRDGGWHFTRVISPEEIHQKELDAEHHDEYRLSKKDITRVSDLIKRKTIDYDHKADSNDFKFSREFKLKTLSLNHMPLFLQQNVEKYSKWFDLEK